jgi:hypothetical protein
MLVALCIQHVMRMSHIVIRGMPCTTTFFSVYLINGTILGEKNVIEHKMYV